MNLFAELTPAERHELSAKLSSASRQFAAEHKLLDGAPAVVLEAYGLSPKTAINYLYAACETTVLNVETGTGYESDRRYWL